MTCNEIQERLAWGRELTLGQRSHVADCPDCAKVGASYHLLDQSLRSISLDVPAGFADRVMERVNARSPHLESDWFTRRWIQLAFVYGGAGVAVFNLVRFLLGVLVPSVGLGGTQ